MKEAPHYVKGMFPLGEKKKKVFALFFTEE